MAFPGRTAMPRLPISVPGLLASTAVFALAWPELIFLYRSGAHLDHLFPWPIIEFIDPLARMRFPLPLMYAANWFLFVVGFGLQVTAFALVQRWVLNRMGRSDYLACGLMGGLTAGVLFLVMIVGFALWAGGMTNVLSVSRVAQTVVPIAMWLTPFGVLQWITYRAIAAVEPGLLLPPPVETTLPEPSAA